jgi:signal transduction histidine kinase/predicted CoA-binding protein
MAVNAFLRKVPLFADLPEADLERLCRMIEEVQLPEGETLFREGEAGDRAYVIEEGEIEIVKASAGREVLLAVREPGDVIGEAALLEEAPRMAAARARTQSKLLSIDKAVLDELVKTSGTAARTMFFTVLARWRATGTMLRHSEKMAQLGTLTAGVAHELNNPAAAVKRGVAQLDEALDTLSKAQRSLGALALSAAEQAALDPFGAEARERGRQPVTMDALALSDLEQELEGWLEGRGVAEPWSIAPVLANMGADTARLEALAAALGGAQDRLSAAAAWLASTYNVANLLAEIGQGAGRISEIVKALKSYSYLDQAPVQQVDIHEGLDNTLLILRGKLKAGIEVKREYAKDVPKIEAWGSELNQVWTNIIDNAADALTEKGPEGGKDAKKEILIRTRCEGPFVVVEIHDNGPGIPAEIVGKVFDPFFTTKPPGKGTGMGLDISYKIIVDKHRGDIRVYSRPGDTTFEVKLPIKTGGKALASAPPVAATSGADDAALRRILTATKTIAVVGLSSREGRPANTVPAALKERGYRIIPVNPTLTEALGEKAYPSLADVPDPVDAAVLFLRTEDVPPVVEQAIAKGVKTVWMQEGIVNEAAAHRARAAGLEVVMDRCMRATWDRLMKSAAR